MRHLLVRLRSCRGRPGMADAARHAVRATAGALDLPELLGRRRTSSWCCPMPEAAAPLAAATRPSPCRGVPRRRRTDGGLPIVNPALAGRGGGFAPGRAAGSASWSTPWFMNLALRRATAAMAAARCGAKRTYAFPPPATSSFIGARDDVDRRIPAVLAVLADGNFTDHRRPCRRRSSRSTRCSTRRTPRWPSRPRRIHRPSRCDQGDRRGADVEAGIPHGAVPGQAA